MLHNRKDAGIQLASMLADYADRKDSLVLGLARGGIPVAFEVSKALHLPLDVFMVRKLGVPGQEELAMGATTLLGGRVLNDSIIADLELTEADIGQAEKKAISELNQQNQSYRKGKQLPQIENKHVILIDDGIATGATIRAAIKAIRALKCAEIVVATPVAPPDTVRHLEALADKVIAVKTPEPFFAIGNFYDDFSQVGDEEVCDFLERAQESSK